MAAIAAPPIWMLDAPLVNCNGVEELAAGEVPLPATGREPVEDGFGARVSPWLVEVADATGTVE
jgi:hypothetical protein